MEEEDERPQHEERLHYGHPMHQAIMKEPSCSKTAARNVFWDLANHFQFAVKTHAR